MLPPPSVEATTQLETASCEDHLQPGFTQVQIIFTYTSFREVQEAIIRDQQINPVSCDAAINSLQIVTHPEGAWSVGVICSSSNPINYIFQNDRFSFDRR